MNGLLLEQLIKNKSTSLLSLMPRQSSPRGISSVKLKTLKSFLNAISENHRSFYNTLDSIVNNNLKDLNIEIAKKKSNKSAKKAKK